MLEMPKQMQDGQQYFLGRDNSGHWYIVEADKESEWNEWLDIDEDDERSWQHPDFATPVNGSPSQVKFTLFRKG